MCQCFVSPLAVLSTSSSSRNKITSIPSDGSRAAEQYVQSKDTAKRVLLEKLLSNAIITNKTVAQYSFKSPYELIAHIPKNPTISQMLADLS